MNPLIVTVNADAPIVAPDVVITNGCGAARDRQPSNAARTRSYNRFDGRGEEAEGVGERDGAARGDGRGWRESESDGHTRQASDSVG